MELDENAVRISGLDELAEAGEGFDPGVLDAPVREGRRPALELAQVLNFECEVIESAVSGVERFAEIGIVLLEAEGRSSNQQHRLAPVECFSLICLPEYWEPEHSVVEREARFEVTN